ncbi:MAG: dihydropteroate synthase [Chlorobi bacterium]|nr:dihydropteroate synthase [Chlorobiota bacterium]
MSDKRKFPQIMGILNVTPDSFSDGGKFDDVDAALYHCGKMTENRIDIIDIGGESSRPGAAAVDAQEEISRVVPIIKKIKEEFPNLKISIDTTKSSVARAAADAGVDIINDISGLDFDPKIADVAAEYNLKLILMHMQGTPRTMQENPHYNDVVEDVFDILQKKIEFARSRGVKSVIGDVGIGFGKTLEHNLTLLRRHSEFSKLCVPMLLGISRKSFIHKMLNIENPLDRDIPTAIIHALMLNSGADIIRVHNTTVINMLKNIYIAVG